MTTVLIVDDEEMIRALGRKILERAGYEVVLADSGQSAVEILGESHQDIDLILADLNMPGVSGLDTLRFARELKPDIPCIISSGELTDLDDIPDELNQGVAFLRKPYRAGDLTGLVDSLLAQGEPQKAQTR